MKATQKQLAELHGLLVEIMIEECKLSKAEGIPMAASTMQVMVTFLKNNGVTAEPDSNEMQVLREGFGNLTELRSEKVKSILASAKADPLLN